MLLPIHQLQGTFWSLSFILFLCKLFQLTFTPKFHFSSRYVGPGTFTLFIQYFNLGLCFQKKTCCNYCVVSKDIFILGAIIRSMLVICTRLIFSHKSLIYVCTDLIPDVAGRENARWIPTVKISLMMALTPFLVWWIEIIGCLGEEK